MNQALEKRRDELAENHWDKRVKIFNIEEFDKETIGVESWKLGFDEACAILLPLIEEARKGLEFYTLQSSYSVVDEGRNYNVEYKTYELNENTCADEILGTRARQSLNYINSVIGEVSK